MARDMHQVAWLPRLMCASPDDLVAHHSGGSLLQAQHAQCVVRRNAVLLQHLGISLCMSDSGIGELSQCTGSLWFTPFTTSSHRQAYDICGSELRNQT